MTLFQHVTVVSFISGCQKIILDTGVVAGVKHPFPASSFFSDMLSISELDATYHLSISSLLLCIYYMLLKPRDISVTGNDLQEMY
jgi:hypothetical protein